ncbi:MAG: hypothetical protein KAH20_08145 [Methylococcales bacterium]|nr:hypothetical protein [Methylococcales bacterium]
MDAGIASADNIAWLIKQDYHYLVISRERHVKDLREQESPVTVRETQDSRVVVYREVDTKTKETRLYCHSDLKSKKEQGIRNRFHVHTLRHRLRLQGIHLSWDSIRNIMSTQQRLTITLPTDNDTIIHLRTTSKAEARQKQIDTALNINPDPIGKYKTTVDMKSVVPTETD